MEGHAIVVDASHGKTLGRSLLGREHGGQKNQDNASVSHIVRAPLTPVLRLRATSKGVHNSVFHIRRRRPTRARAKFRAPQDSDKHNNAATIAITSPGIAMAQVAVTIKDDD